jgi:hypothetical protein
MSITARRIRLAIDTTSFDRLVDASTGQSLRLWRGNAVAFEFALFFRRGQIIADLSNLQSLTLELKTPGAGDTAPAPEAAPVATATISSFTDGITTEQFSSGAAQHGAFTFTGAQMNLAAGKYWVVIAGLTADVPARPITFGTALIDIAEDGFGEPGSPPELPDIYLTAAQSDARYLPRGALTALEGTLTISGAGTTAANKLYNPDGTANGRRRWTAADGTTDDDSTLWTGTRWEVRSAGDILYYSNENVTGPELVNTWIAEEGEAPLPTVTYDAPDLAFADMSNVTPATVRARLFPGAVVNLDDDLTLDGTTPPILTLVPDGDHTVTLHPTPQQSAQQLIRHGGSDHTITVQSGLLEIDLVAGDMISLVYQGSVWELLGRIVDLGALAEKNTVAITDTDFLRAAATAAAGVAVGNSDTEIPVLSLAIPGPGLWHVVIHCTALSSPAPENDLAIAYTGATAHGIRIGEGAGIVATVNIIELADTHQVIHALVTATEPTAAIAITYADDAETGSTGPVRASIQATRIPSV